MKEYAYPQPDEPKSIPTTTYLSFLDIFKKIEKSIYFILKKIFELKLIK